MILRILKKTYQVIVIWSMQGKKAGSLLIWNSVTVGKCKVSKPLLHMVKVTMDRQQNKRTEFWAISLVTKVPAKCKDSTDKCLVPDPQLRKCRSLYLQWGKEWNLLRGYTGGKLHLSVCRNRKEGRGQGADQVRIKEINWWSSHPSITRWDHSWALVS